MAKAGTVREGVQLSGKWEWKDDPINPSLEFISFNPNADRQDRRKRAKGHDGKGRGDRAASGMQRGGKMGRGRGAVSLKPPAKSAPSKKDQSEHTTVTLEDIKNVALERMSEVDPIPEHFIGLLRREQLNIFLLYLLSYFNCYFNKITLENKKNPMYIEPSVAETLEIANACERLSVAQKLLGRAYCILVLGLGLEEQHHMECGGSRVSKTYTDRSMFETLYNYCTFVVWITFRRRDFDGVKKEIGRILRSNTFNPAIRVKYAPEEPKEVDPTKAPKKEEAVEEKKEPEPEKKLTAAEYRRLHPKRPAIKSIINQRSPAIVSILPSPKEEAHWLFRQPKIMNAELAAQAQEDDDDVDTIDEKYSDLLINMDKFKTGILGEPYKMFNPQTLSPQGAENEDEENEGEDGEKGASEDAQNGEKTQVSDHGTSRNQTAISHATTEGFADDEP
ncbi:protein phosphatase 1 regulatory subunit 36-like [Plakobranchus ocellatus]|uniref:Protein phosphatase 1 regulatory subunit 36-like n=1 Tax=Plakobranchus ocellatus TaxID=259542 RepID=A0AAV4C9Y4_9GAST|nr:protein phosphatase 1 regulatory subunit 36-like [Plakobranchus ocellatus]